MKYQYNYLKINNAKEYFDAIDNNFVCLIYPTYLVNKLKDEILSFKDDSLNKQYGYARFLYSNFQNENELYKAYGIIKKLSEINHLPSTYFYGLILMDGKVVKDEIKAIECFKQGYKKNFALSIFELAKAYYYGRGVKQNINKAIKLLNKASKMNCSQAMTFLASLYINGNQNIKINYDKALKLLNNSISLSNPNAYYMLAQMYHKGIGVDIDLDKAFMYYDNAAKDEVVDALLMCGHLLLTNQISESENLNANDYYKKAAYLNNAEGMYFYATNLLIGKGCKKNIVEGRKLMQKAANLGHELAIKITNGKKENENENKTI